MTDKNPLAHYSGVLSEAVQESAAADVKAAQPIAPEFNLKTSAGGRGYVSWYFSNVMQRHDFGNYITKTLAADFACALSSWLRDGKPRVESWAAPTAQAAAVPDERMAFEAWASKAGYSIERWKNDYLLYADQKTDIAWEIWQARAALAATPAADSPMVDMTPPATSRDRWMYEQGRLAERDARTPGSVAAQAKADALDAALTEIIGCFDAANSEGLDDALVNNTDARLTDLVQRRMMPAYYAAIAAQAAQQGGE